MNIVFLTRYKPGNINTWSGTLYHIYNELKKNNNVTVIGENIVEQGSLFIYNNFVNHRHPSRYAPILSDICSERINNLKEYDLVFFGDIYITPYLNVNIPMIYISDITYHKYKYYLEREDDSDVEKIEKIEKKALENSDAIIYSSEWTKQDAVNYYKINPQKIHVVEFGANIPSPKNIDLKVNLDVCNLVFIGRNWEKKGGDKAIGAYEFLRKWGIPTTITIIGSTPKGNFLEDKNVTIIPFIDKNNKEEMRLLDSIYRKSHFLILPTEFDAYGIVFCEASAYGVPSIAPNVGGVSQPIKEGKNGYLMSPSASAEDYAKLIKKVFLNKEEYLKLRETSRLEYEERLNWDVWEKRVNNILLDVVNNYKKRK